VGATTKQQQNTFPVITWEGIQISEKTNSYMLVRCGGRAMVIQSGLMIWGSNVWFRSITSCKARTGLHYRWDSHQATIVPFTTTNVPHAIDLEAFPCRMRNTSHHHWRVSDGACGMLYGIGDMLCVLQHTSTDIVSTCGLERWCKTMHASRAGYCCVVTAACA